MIAAARVRERNARGAASRTQPPVAWLYLAAVVASAVAVGGLAVAGGRPSAEAWATFAALAGCAAIAQLFLVATGSNHGFNTAVVFVVASALLLPVELVALLGLAQHIPDVLRRRYPWYIAAFNVANYTLAGLTSWAAARLVLDLDTASHGLRFAVAGLAAAFVWIVVNHALLAGMLRLVRGRTLRESGLFSAKSVGTEFAVGAVGVALAFLWMTNPWLAPAVVAPLVLSHRSFSNLGALRETEERFRAMFESALVGAVVLDLDGRILSSNRAIEEMLGYTKEELAGTLTADLVHDDDRDRELALFRELVDGRRPEYRLEQRYRAKDGRVVWAELAVSLARDADDFPRFAIAMFDDATKRRSEDQERARLEHALRQAQKMEAVGQLAGGIAHDFNNLLTAIGGYAELALGRPDAAAPALRRDIEEIAKSADRASSLTRQLLGFSRKQIMQQKVLDLNDVVSDVEKMLRRLIGENIEVATVYGRGVPRVLADPGQLEQVLMNLVVNARDAMPDGGRLVIETGSRTVDAATAEERPGLVPGPYVTLAVRDNGHGIDPETQARVFEPFFTTKEPGKGTGLGLATVYGIVKQNGGYVEVESSPGRGATFTVYLRPLDGEPAEDTNDEPVPAAAARGSETVLLVEDEDLVRNLLREVLEANGYVVLEAPNGLQALELARTAERPVQLLITDVVMPKMSGHELADQLRAVHRKARILYMSGYTDGAIVERGVLDPSTEFLQKPFSFDDLAKKVRSILDAAA